MIKEQVMFERRTSLPFTRNSPCDFFVHTAPVFAHDHAHGVQLCIPDTKATLRGTSAENTQVLGCVSQGYNVFQNTGVFWVIESAIAKLFGLPVTCAIVDRAVQGGRFCIRHYIIRPVDTQGGEAMRIGNSDMLFRVTMFNSFDGSRRFSMLSGMIDWYCLNGSFSGDFVSMMKTHSGALDPEDMFMFLQESYQSFLKSVRLMRVAKSVAFKDKDQAHKLLFELSRTDTFRKNIVDELAKNVDVHGPNMWAVISTATWWASCTDHTSWAVPLINKSDSAEVRDDRLALRNHDRQLIVMDWMKKSITPILSRYTFENELERVGND